MTHSQAQKRSFLPPLIAPRRWLNQNTVQSIFRGAIRTLCNLFTFLPSKMKIRKDCRSHNLSASSPLFSDLHGSWPVGRILSRRLQSTWRAQNWIGMIRWIYKAHWICVYLYYIHNTYIYSPGIASHKHYDHTMTKQSIQGESEAGANWLDISLPNAPLSEPTEIAETDVTAIAPTPSGPKDTGYDGTSAGADELTNTNAPPTSAAKPMSKLKRLQAELARSRSDATYLADEVSILRSSDITDTPSAMVEASKERNRETALHDAATDDPSILAAMAYGRRVFAAPGSSVASLPEISTSREKATHYFQGSWHEYDPFADETCPPDFTGETFRVAGSS
jgi:hypothetical protein